MINDEEITRSNDPKLANARVFIGNLPSDRTTKEDLQEKFKHYGKILGIAIHKGYAFVQYDNEGDALKAVDGEHNSNFKGQLLDLRISTQGGRRGPPMAKRPPPPFKRPYPDEPPYGEEWHGGDDRFRDPYWHPPPGDHRGPPPPFREPPPHDDPYWRDRYPPPHPPMMPPPHRNGGPPHDPYRDEREMFPPPPSANEPPGGPKKVEYGVERPFDAVIVVTQKSLKLYAEMVERRLFELNMTVDMIFLIHDGALNKAIDDMTRRGVLYILVVQPQHEEHSSITVNIMHGTPQEHRNMPLDDALAMMARNFNAYLSNLRSGSEQPTMGFLLNLLADGKHLSIVELDRIIAHLQDRRDRLVEAEGGKKDAQAPSSSAVNPTAAAAAVNPSVLQQKILGILGNTLLNSATAAAAVPQTPAAPPALALANLAQQFGINISQAAAASSAGQSASSALPKLPDAAAKLQFSDPNLKKTLDSLLQNPNLLKTLVPQASSLQQNTQKFTPPPVGGPPPMGGGPPPQGLLGGPGGGGPPGPPQTGLPPPQRPPLNPNIFGGQSFGGPPMPDGMGPRGGPPFHAPFGPK